MPVQSLNIDLSNAAVCKLAFSSAKWWMITTSKLTILINGEKPVCLSYELDDVFSF